MKKCTQCGYKREPLDIECPLCGLFYTVEKENVKSSTSYQRDWKKLNTGEKCICVSIFMAIGSLFLPWVETGSVSLSGWQQQGYIALLFFIYPAYILLKKKKANIYIGCISSILSTLLIIGHMGTKTMELFDTTVHVYGSGSWVFLAASLLLGYGFIKIGKGSNTFANQIKKHKWKILLIISLLVISPKAYDIVSVKFNKPYNLFMNLSVNSTKDDIQEANKNISKLNNTKLITTAAKHLQEISKKLESPNKDSEELLERKLAFFAATVKLLDRNLEILESNMTPEELAERRGTQKTPLPKISSSIRENCEKKWGDDYVMIKYCIERQTEARKSIYE